MAGLCVTAATIDNGNIEHPYHDIGALTFFLLFNFIMFVITVEVRKMQQIFPQSFSMFSVISKIVLSVLLLILYAVEIYLKFVHPTLLELPPDKYRNIVEWGSMLIFCSFLYTLGYDLKAAELQIDVKLYKFNKPVADSEHVPIMYMQAPQIQNPQFEMQAQPLNYVQMTPKSYVPIQSESQDKYPALNPNAPQ